MNRLNSYYNRGQLAAGLLAAVLAVTGCGKDEGKPAAGATSSQFPGYQQVGASGDAAQLWFNPADITRSGSWYVVHALKSFPNGYARFDVTTNCRETTKRMAGTQYRDDGTAEKDYPGNDSSVLAKSEPGMGELMQTACGVAMASRAITGEFNAPAALELLYGPYTQATATARWDDASVPADLPWRDNLSLTAGGALDVKSVATFTFAEGGKSKKVLVTSATPQGGGCHACTGLLGVAVFVQDGGKWKIESNQPYVASMGASGSVGNHFEWMAAGDDTYALVVGGGDMHQGYETASTAAFLRQKDGKFVNIVDDGDTGSSDQQMLSASTTFIKGKDSAHYDVKVTISYTMPGKSVYVADHIYQYSGGKYVLTKKDDPPKSVNLAAASDDSSVQQSAPAVPAMSNPALASTGSGAFAPSFDCSKARSDSEHLICADAELSARDVELASLFARARAAVADKTAFRERTRQQWNYRESACHDRQCLMRWYDAQRTALSQIAQTGQLD
ncbi:hypothetical protein KTD33_00415 [Burkholderia gladioli]|uniref:lysozyme inhibitor LprI family protein n=1 Tax=Burkholderia gladioli TaxID=28095 RepID=UPI001C2102C8|nr:hypothetical protein [Burkholderia gladioli]MBU9192994.1 hypothetical protein [Burkholderia gladioli]